MLTISAAGGGEMEIEKASIKQPIPVGNEPGFSYLPGRDGWKLMSLDAAALPKIPRQQEIWAAG
jgi:hypothetical protein